MQNVLIVGASSSIGGAVVARFREPSTRLITTYASTAPTNPQERAEALLLDLRDNPSIDAFAKQVGMLAPQIDVGIFLAGILPGKSLADYDFAAIDEVMSINFNGQAKLIHRLLPLLSARSRLLLCSSISAQRGSFDPIYAASKGALLSFVKSLVNRLPPGARINAIAPGLIQDSTMFEDMSPERREFHRGQLPSKQLLLKQDLAEIIYDLCRDHWAHLNGACIDLNGGQHVR
jgi:3-oxoacyl-[acyl-carrier protein] reductase